MKGGLMMAESELEGVLVRLIATKFDELMDLVSQLDDDSANTVLPVEGSNSVVQLLSHCCGMMRHWSSSVNLGIEVPRDRDAEFEAVMPVAEALELAAEARSAFLDDVERTDLSGVPKVIPPGRQVFWTVTAKTVLLHVLEEICQHLGHAEVTRDVVLGGMAFRGDG